MQAVEATAEAEQLVYKPKLDAQAQPIIPITNFVVVLSMNWALHGQNSWQGDSVTLKYADHTLWNADFLNIILQYFLDLAGASSIPDMGEFAWRSDKVMLSASPPNVRPSRASMRQHLLQMKTICGKVSKRYLLAALSPACWLVLLRTSVVSSSF